jgi:signal transduction histidine kinase
MIMNSFFTSNWDFSADENDLRSKFQMINIAILLSSVSLAYGIIGNIVRDISGLIPIEVTLLGVNFVLFFMLRRCKKSFYYVAWIETLQFTFLFLFLIYVSRPDELKHIWVFTYPMLLLYFQTEKNAKYWVVFMIGMLLIAPIQNFVEVQYSMYQVSYISFVLSVISVIIYFYQKKMDEAKELILQQQKIMNIQSKHAIMGEMISMIAHQWRQPLSTVTLNISNLQINKLLGKKVEEELVDKTLEEINKTIVYLSNTIDDFQTFFHPNRKMEKVMTRDLLKKVMNFVEPRLKDSKLSLGLEVKEDVLLETYANELVQVILNLVNNAIDALLATGKEKKEIIIRAEREDDFLKISVIDNADGIKESDLERVFEPYFSTKGKNGTGLGLYMSQMIMQKQFGTQIEISSSPKGSSFAIIVPNKLQ